MEEHDKPESRVQYIVKDKPTENGVRLNNVLTGLLLAAALWVGSSVEDLKSAVVLLASEQSHAAEDLEANSDIIAHNVRRITTLERLHPEYYLSGGGAKRDLDPDYPDLQKEKRKK